MGIDFNIDEILGMAEKIERNGAAFYRKAADGISDDANKAMLNELAAMEDEHEKTFAAMRAGLTDQEKEGTVFDPENETAQYLNALADMRVFFEKTIDTTSMKEILKDAITAEKDSILFYQGMQGLTGERLGKGKIDAIIQEEMSHIRILTNKLKEV